MELFARSKLNAKTQTNNFRFRSFNSPSFTELRYSGLSAILECCYHHSATLSTHNEKNEMTSKAKTRCKRNTAGIIGLQDGGQTDTRHRASTSMYSLTFCVRFLLPVRHQRKPAIQAAAVTARADPAQPAVRTMSSYRGWTQACN